MRDGTMSDHQKIHPTTVDPEAPPARPSAPLPLHSILRSEKDEPGGQHQNPLRRNVTIPVMPPRRPPPPPPPLVFKPKLPKYSVDNLRISDLTLNFDLSLCQGSIPRFYQGYQNKTLLNVALAGQNPYGRTLLEALQEQQQTGRIPLDLKFSVPVSIKLKSLKLRKVKITGTCNLIVDSLSTNSFIRIRASTCNFGVKF